MDGPQTPEQQIERLEGAVGSLSAEQKAKLKDIYAKASEKMQAIPQEQRSYRLAPWRSRPVWREHRLRRDQRRKFPVRQSLPPQ